ncbi:MAG: hypothetical protein BWY85_02228 [Firmicutes bacterium ADurb.Bin506]|nr:MAG: hypothetical protein BWY85_02228 [Firmicutes bacterium ADurb.Bin506]
MPASSNASLLYTRTYTLLLKGIVYHTPSNTQPARRPSQMSSTSRADMPFGPLTNFSTGTSSLPSMYSAAQLP